MDLGMNLELEQKQELIMTPRLKMAIELLQYNNQELAEYLTNSWQKIPCWIRRKIRSGRPGWRTIMTAIPGRSLPA